MRVFFDTEFLEDGNTIDLISIGLVREYDWKTLYLINRDCDWRRVYNDEWLCNNVVPHLPPVNQNWRSKDEIKNIVHTFCTRAGKVNPKFWAYYADYDWVAFCQLFGKMIDLPKGFPMYCNDFKQHLVENNLSAPPLSEDKAHDALEDAKWLASSYSKLVLKSKQQYHLKNMIKQGII